MKSEQDSITRNTLITLFNSYDKDISSEETISSFEEEKKCVQGCLRMIQSNFVRLGWHLKKLKEEFKDNITKTYFEARGHYCRNIYDFAQQEFNLSKSSVKRLIAIVDKFCLKNDIELVELKESYKNFSYSQLSEMLSLTNEQLSKVNSDMSSREIRALGKSGPAPGQKIKSEENSGIQRFYKLKNKDIRLNFLKNYRKWTLKAKVENLNLYIYSCPLSNGDLMLMFETRYFNSSYGKEDVSKLLTFQRKQDNCICLFDTSQSDFLQKMINLDVGIDPDVVLSEN